MTETLPLIGAARHPNTLRNVPIRMAKADANFLRNREIQAEIGAALGRAISVAGFTRKEAAGLLEMPESQLSDWIAGKASAHIQTARVMASEPLRLPFIEALARWAGAAVEITIRFEERRTA